MSIRWSQIAIILLSILFISGCNRSSPVVSSSATIIPTSEPAITTSTETYTPNPPTATPIPLAALVNGEGIRMDEYLGELSLFQAALPITGTNLASDPGVIVLDELINQTLLAQAAAQNGFIVDETMLSSRISALENKLGGTQALESWISTHGYSSENFHRALKRGIEAAWMRDQVIAAVPETADEVHVRQILVPSAREADEAFAALQSGADFLELAYDYDPITGGDLGWFPRGYLEDRVIEDAAFALQPGQYSQVIETEIGYHILYLAERDENHSLQPDARLAMQKNAIHEWIKGRREQSDIQVLLP